MDILTFALIMLLVVGLLTSMILQSNSLQREREEWREEKKDLLDRVMTKEWESYVQVKHGGTQGLSQTEYIGMTDEEELERMRTSFSDGEGVGEVIVEMPDSEETLMSDLRDLGLVDDE